MIDRTVDILSDLVAFPTVSSDSNLAMIDYMADLLERAGAEVEILVDPTGEKVNLFATIGPAGDGGFVLSGHSDVVPVKDQEWATDPFTLVEDGDRLYGRGTCDMKGFLAVCLAFAPQFAKARLSRPIHFAFTYDEEVGCIGAGQLAQALRARGLTPRCAIVGEPTLMRIIDGHKGCFEYTVRFQGLEGHGSTPDRGVNAVEYAARYVARLLEVKEDLRSLAPADSPFDPPWTTINVGALHGGAVHNVIAPTAQLDWEMRPVQDSDVHFVKKAMAEFCRGQLMSEMLERFPGARIDTEIIGEVSGLVPTAKNEARDIVASLTGANSTDQVAFGTEAGIFQNLGMDVVVCGPGSIAQAHKANEFVSRDQLRQCAEFMHSLVGYLDAKG